MNDFYIVTNDGKDKDFSVTAHIIDILENAGKTCYLSAKDGEKKIIEKSVPEKIDCAIVIGGDGTLIEAARVLHGRNVPILGINMGTLGYLTEVEVGSIDEAIRRIIDGDFALENRMMLEGMCPDGTKKVALNDVVVSRKGILRVIHFKIYVNGELLNSYEADGIIISTPTGSTAYNLSAGGPIMEPGASMFVITPICSHALNTSSVVLSGDDEIVVEIGEARNGNKEEVYTTFDGMEVVPMCTGDRMVITRSKDTTKLMKLSNLSFLEILRRKMMG